MGERGVALLCGVGALLLFATLFLRVSAPTLPESLPTSVDIREGGLAGAAAWLRSSGVRVLALRKRFDSLARRGDLPRRGNLLVVSVPAAVALHSGEAKALEDWIRGGNTLLVLAALADRPGWARADATVAGDLQLLTKLEVSPQAPTAPARTAARGDTGGADNLQRLVQAARRLGEPQRATVVPNRPHAFLAGVAAVQGLSDYPPRQWRVSAPRDGFMLSLAHQREPRRDALWVRDVGAGTTIVSALASPFSNRLLAEADNARLLANIVSTSVAADGAVLFDDQHQGLGLAYDAARFYRDPRLYATLAVIAAVWLAWVLGSTRLRLPAVRNPVPREGQLVRATGLFLARVLQPAAAARLMFAHFFRAVQPQTPPGPAQAQQAWDVLENHPRLRRADLAQLRDWYQRAGAGARVPLADLHNLLLRIERQLHS
ncbi:MAG: DUF4350 domain-containing protein [Proteobacteria bacterium]|nr:DUF4350 domain-containing protein [Pseudomonadota bacterium]